MKAGSHLEQRTDSPPNISTTPGGFGDARKNLEERTLTGAVPPNEANDFTLLNLEGSILQRPDCRFSIVSIVTRRMPKGRTYSAEGGDHSFSDHITKRRIALALADLILLRDSFRDYGHITHS